jgi:hypothetical protein
LTDSSSLYLNSGSNIYVDGGIISGAYIYGDGSNLINIPASGVTGLELNKIVSGSVSASIVNGQMLVNSDVIIDGILTARELHIDYVTSSVLYTSGSTKFGDTSDDTHQFTGSVFVSGSVNITSGSLVIDGVSFSAMTSGTSGTAGTSGTSGTSGVDGVSGTSGTSGSSGSDGTSGTSGSSGSSGTSGVDGVSGTSGTSGSSGIDGTSGSSGISGVDGTDGSSGTSGVDGVSGTSGTSGSSGSDGSSGTSGSSGSDGSSGTSGVDGVSGTSGTSGSSGSDGTSGTSGDSLFALTGSVWSTTNDVEITGSLHITSLLGITDSNVIMTDSSSLYLTSGSNIYVDGGIISGAYIYGDGSNLINIPASGVTGLQLNQITSGSNTASIDLNGFNINTNTSITGSVDITGSLYVNGQVVGTGKLDENWFNSYVSSSLSQFAGTSSYATYAENAVIVSGANKQLEISVPSTTWSFNHNLHERYPVINIFDSNGYVVIPTNIQTVDLDNLIVYFNTPETGRVVASVGGAGTSGTSGSSGSDGTSGTSGSSGSDGSSGTSGTSGSSGSDGSSGTSGSSGSDGTSGTSGTSGVDGVSGTSGTSGSSGSDGSSGSSGDSLFALTGSHWNTTNNVQITGSLDITSQFGVTDSNIVMTDSSSLYITSGSNVYVLGGQIDVTNGDIIVNTGNLSVDNGTISGSFVGDGAGLYNIPSSGITGLNLDRITSGSVSASLEDGTLKVNTDLYVDGTITAKELNINYVSSSVLYESGSTKFGDSLDDTHQITGSLSTTGSVTINGDLVVNGTTTLRATDPLRDSLIISGALALMQNQINAQIISASISMQGQKINFQDGNVNVMDMGSF